MVYGKFQPNRKGSYEKSPPSYAPVGCGEGEKSLDSQVVRCQEPFFHSSQAWDLSHQVFLADALERRAWCGGGCRSLWTLTSQWSQSGSPVIPGSAQGRTPQTHLFSEHSILHSPLRQAWCACGSSGDDANSAGPCGAWASAFLTSTQMTRCCWSISPILSNEASEILSASWCAKGTKTSFYELDFICLTWSFAK